MRKREKNYLIVIYEFVLRRFVLFEIKRDFESLLKILFFLCSMIQILGNIPDYLFFNFLDRRILEFFFKNPVSFDFFCLSVNTYYILYLSVNLHFHVNFSLIK